MPRKKRHPLTIAKAKCWKLCSQYIRLKYSDQWGMATCFTCGMRKPWKEQQAGHFISGRTNGILFDERGLRVQCYVCNIHHYGEPIKYMIALEKELGTRQARTLRDTLLRKKNSVTTISLDQYKLLI